jgi:hypothetical protein
MLTERRWYLQPKQQRKLAAILTSVHTLGRTDRRLQATNTNDRIYALLGLATDANDLGIVADHQKSVDTILYQDSSKDSLSRFEPLNDGSKREPE